MKVVLFCGGLGMRIRDAEDMPKPMVRIGYRPILWHVMKYYAHYGHQDFILCLGHGADTIKDYFLNYDECISNDFVLSECGKKVELFSRDIDDWRITFVDTGINSNIGQRLKAVRKHLKDEREFPRQLQRRADRPSASRCNSSTSTRRARSRAFFASSRTSAITSSRSHDRGSGLVSGIIAINDGACASTAASSSSRRRSSTTSRRERSSWASPSSG